jgi:hypothetical protein
LLVDVVANDEELVSGRVAAADGSVEDVLCVLDQVGSLVEVVYVL